MNRFLSFTKSSTVRQPAGWIGPAALTLLSAGATPLAAQVKLPPLQFEDSNRQGFFVRLGPRIQFNVEASVTTSAQTPQQPGFYDNGFVQPDAGGTASGLTWNWGYQDAGQVNGDSLEFTRYSNLPHAGVFAGESDDPVLGGEVMFGVEFGRFAVGRREFSWGAEIGYGLSQFKLSNTSTAAGTVDYLAARHALNGILPPVAPYQGTFIGPGPLIDLNPSEALAISSAAAAAFDGSVKSDLHAFKLGLWLEAPLTRQLSASLSLGYSSVFADTRLEFRETVTIDDPNIPAVMPANVSAGADNWLGGFYGQLRATWMFSDRWGAYVAGDYQYNNKFSFSESGRDVTLDFKGTYGASLGLIFSW